MNKMPKGFTLVETLLVTLIVAVVGFGGYTVWHNEKNKKTVSSSTSPSTEQTITSADCKAQGGGIIGISAMVGKEGGLFCNLNGQTYKISDISKTGTRSPSSPESGPNVYSFKDCQSAPGSVTSANGSICTTNDGQVFKHDISGACNPDAVHPNFIATTTGTFVSYDAKAQTITYSPDKGSQQTKGWCTTPSVTSSPPAGSGVQIASGPINLTNLKKGDQITITSDWSGITTVAE